MAISYTFENDVMWVAMQGKPEAKEIIEILRRGFKDKRFTAGSTGIIYNLALFNRHITYLGKDRKIIASFLNANPINRSAAIVSDPVRCEAINKYKDYIAEYGVQHATFCIPEHAEKFVKGDDSVPQANYNTCTTTPAPECLCKGRQDFSEVRTLGAFLPKCSSCKDFRDDKGYPSPKPVSFTHTMMQSSEFDFKQMSVHKLAGTQKALTITLNNRLVPVDIPKETELFIKHHFSSAGRRFIPEPIDQWIRRQIAPKGCLEPNSGPWMFKMSLPELDLYCKANIVFTELKHLALVVLMIPHNQPEDFSILELQGLTGREIETLSYLPQGCTNKQIAMAMDIEEVTVKKHLKNAAQKLDAFGKTDTLYKALQQKELLETLHP